MISWGFIGVHADSCTSSSAASAAPVLGRTHLGSFPPCEDQSYVERIRSPPSFIRQDHRTPRGPQPPCHSERVLRLARRQRGLAGPVGGRPARTLGSRGDP